MKRAVYELRITYYENVFRYSNREGGIRLLLKLQRYGISCLLIMLFAVACLNVTLAAHAEGTNSKEQRAGQQLVYVIPVAQPIESGLQQFLERAFREAEEAKASYIVLEMNTPGGRLDNALEIGKLIRESPVPTVAYVLGEAASAGSYLSLCADRIVMAPGSMIGAAAIVDASGKPVESAKTIAAWASIMRSAAEKNNRDGNIAVGMVDANAVVEMKAIQQTKEKGQIISLSAKEALAVGYADKLVNSLDEAIAFTGVQDYIVQRVELTFMERLAEWLTNPVVSTILLFIGIAGVAIELIVPGFGVPGIVGVIGFGLYFFGNFVAGFAEKESLVLFVLGLILLVCELFVPSFGILGILGSGALIAGVVMAAFNTSSALISLGIAFAAALIVVIIVAKIFQRRGIWNRFILKDQLTTEQGYVSAETKESLLHKQGISLTPLRPSGSVIIDGERIDVVTEGSFIAANRQVIVSKIDGTRVIVQEI